ncbi:14-3-3 domain-containing protein [Ilyonectria destructans]|nr:14-3-3 domain-containing protein [Ilyonectria destructans]
MPLPLYPIATFSIDSLSRFATQNQNAVPSKFFLRAPLFALAQILTMLHPSKLVCQAFLARLCERAERYDDMVTHVNEIAKFGDELSSDEQNLLSTAFRNVVGTRRVSLRIISSIEKMESQSGENHVATIREYRHKIANELKEVCHDISKSFSCRIRVGEQRNIAISSAQEAYKIATDIAQIELAATHPLRLGVALNFSDFYYEIQNSPNRAYHLAKLAVHDVLAKLDSLSEEPFGDCMFTMQTPLWESDYLGVERARKNTFSELFKILGGGSIKCGNCRWRRSDSGGSDTLSLGEGGVVDTTKEVAVTETLGGRHMQHRVADSQIGIHAAATLQSQNALGEPLSGVHDIAMDEANEFDTIQHQMPGPLPSALETLRPTSMVLGIL